MDVTFWDENHISPLNYTLINYIIVIKITTIYVLLFYILKAYKYVFGTIF